MEGIGYWIFLAVLYLLSSLMKKRRQQTIGQQQDKEDPNSTDEVKPNPFQAEFLQDLFRDMKDLVEDPEEISEEEIENIYVDEEVQEIEPEKEVVVASDENSHVVFEDLSEPDPEPDPEPIHEEYKYWKKQKVKMSAFSLSFTSMNDLKRAIVLKEILDKPRALRRVIH
jgi:hypothetical protein